MPRLTSESWNTALPVAQRSVVEHTLGAFRTALKDELLNKQNSASRATALRTVQANLSALLQRPDLGAQPLEDMRARATLAACLDVVVRELVRHA